MKKITIEITDSDHAWLKARVAKCNRRFGNNDATIELRASTCLEIYIDRIRAEENDPADQ